MHPLRIWRRLRNLAHRRELDAALEDEIRFHLEMKAQDNRAAGMTPEQADHAARRRFGNATLAREASREFWGWAWLDHLAQDLRYALRALRANPGFTAVAVLTLALGIGANTAVFTLINAVILRTLPVPNPQELILIRLKPSNDEERTQFSYPFYRDVRDRNTVLSGLIARWTISAALSRDGVTDHVSGHEVTPNYFDILGVRPAIGRMLTPDDERVPVCVLSYRLWRGRFGGDPAIVGSTVQLNAIPFTVAGVADRNFFGTEPGMDPDLYVPLTMHRTLERNEFDILASRPSQWLQVIGRMKPGVTRSQARAALQSTVDGIARDIDKRDAGRVELLSGAQGMGFLRRTAQRPLLVLGASTVLVLLIACANVAALLVARGAARRREIAVRLAIGAGRGRIIRQLLTESLVLAVCGGVCGALAAWPMTALLAVFTSAIGNGALKLDAAPDWRVLAFLSGVVAAAALLFGLAPAIEASRVDTTPALKAAPAAHGRRGISLRRAMVAVQFALCVVLLTGAGLFIGSLRNVRAIETGLNAENLVLATFNPSLNGYSAANEQALYRRLLDRVRALGGVESASLSAIVPLSDQSLWRPDVVPDQPNPGRGFVMNLNAVTPGFFKTFGISLLAGRDFDSRDRDGAPPVAIVTRNLAERFWPGLNPLGKRIRWHRNAKYTVEVVGVVRTHKYQSVEDEDPPVIYTPLAQGVGYESCNDACQNDMILTVRTAADPSAIGAALRAEIHALDRNLPVYNVTTLTTQVNNSEALLSKRLMASLSTAFGAVALLLAAIGLYGVIAYSVARRTREIGIRMALGASAPHVIRLLLRESAGMIALGLFIGLPAAWGASRFIASLLYGLSPYNPAVYAAVVALLAAVSLLAAFLPARRATRIEPTSALRFE